MQEMKTKVGYIRGLIDGLGLDESKSEGKVLVHIVDLLDQITDSILDLDDGYDELVDYVEAIDEDLMELEDDYFEDDEEDEDDDDDDDEDFFTGGFSFECPDCREIVYVDEDVLEQEGSDLEILCPGCGEVVLINDEWGEDEDFIEGEEDDDDEDLPFEDEVIDDNEDNK